MTGKMKLTSEGFKWLYTGEAIQVADVPPFRGSIADNGDGSFTVKGAMPFGSFAPRWTLVVRQGDAFELRPDYARVLPPRKHRGGPELFSRLLTQAGCPAADEVISLADTPSPGTTLPVEWQVDPASGKKVASAATGRLRMSVQRTGTPGLARTEVAGIAGVLLMFEVGADKSVTLVQAVVVGQPAAGDFHAAARTAASACKWSPQVAAQQAAKAAENAPPTPQQLAELASLMRG